MQRLSFFLALCLTAICHCAADSLDIRRLKENYRAILTPSRSASDTLYADLIKIAPETEMSDQIVMELHQLYPFDMAKINGYLGLLSSDGRFSDIDYADTRRSGWQPKMHAERVLELAKLYDTPRSGRYKSPEIKDALHRAIGFWLREKPKSLNWWQNEIGVPKTLGSAFILLEDELSPEEKQGAIEVMSNAKFGRTGQNKVWLAGNVLTRALLQNDEALIRAARDTIASEITVSAGEGIQPDWSFHQHGPQQQLGNYGMSYIAGMSMFCRMFEGTSAAFDSKQRSILESLINEGYKWVVWKRYMDISSLGRQLFHNAQLHKGYASAFAAADIGISGFEKSTNSLVGHKHYFSSDYTVHRRPQWMASLKMSSARVIGTEAVNEDNINGYYLGDGATFFYARGDEYLNMFPLLNWRRIPGVTAHSGEGDLPNIRKNKSRNASRKVGGITVRQSGMSVMQLDRDGLKANKAWIFADDFVVCLGAGISSDSAAAVVTSIDQRPKAASLDMLTSRGWTPVNGRFSRQGGILRLHHDNTGYVVAASDRVDVEAVRRKGAWHNNMRMYTLKEVQGDMIDLSINHGSSPRNASYLYVVIPNAVRDQVEAFSFDAEVKVILNDLKAQVVSLPSKASGYWVAAYEVDPVDIEGRTFMPEAPGVYYLEPRGGELMVVSGEAFH